MNNSLTYALLMLIAGIGIPVMATLNGGLGARLQSPALAATILFFVALVLAFSYLITTEGFPETVFSADVPLHFYFGGFFVLFYILTITWVAPRFGISNSIAFVLLGQLIAMSLIDHFGLMGVQKFAMSLKRLAGLGVMTIGVFLVLNKAPGGPR
ncbi:DMT family transporter [Marinobacter sp.]|uniref:DMT family transporter n=1 Tax=Marinobacter sp. TaxID=50741 RepID=UPI0035C67854